MMGMLTYPLTSIGLRTEFLEKVRTGIGRGVGRSVKAASAKPMRPEGLALRDRLVGIIAMVRPQADLVAESRHGSTSRTIAEVQRNLQLCRTSLRFLTDDPRAATNVPTTVAASRVGAERRLEASVEGVVGRGLTAGSGSSSESRWWSLEGPVGSESAGERREQTAVRRRLIHQSA